MNDHIIFWFRRDLRVEDNHGLYRALKEGLPVIPLFIFDKAILDELKNPADMRVDFIYKQLHVLRQTFKQHNSNLQVIYGEPEAVFRKLLAKYPIRAVYCNHDYEPYARRRDEAMEKLLQSKGVAFVTFKDQVVYEKFEVVKKDGKPYTVFTPYMKQWKNHFREADVEAYPSGEMPGNLARLEEGSWPSLQEMGFKGSHAEFPPASPPLHTIKEYDNWRDFPAQNGTTRLGVHLRFGTVSIRQMMQLARQTNITWWNELIWREFYMMILWQFPRVVDYAFKPAYDRIPWRNNIGEFERWKNGETGFPLVDAGMRELNTTGYMHNRVRMLTASFLTKHLLIDWRWGERYFAEKLLDYELSSNNGGWQWAAGSGCDAAPYFRIFNPDLQVKRFDSDKQYIRNWVPEFEAFSYPRPMVDHKAARERALRVYQNALQNT